MRLEMGVRVVCTDGPVGELADVVVDPVSRRVTHLVVAPQGDAAAARLVPVASARAGGSGDEVALDMTRAQVRDLDEVREFTFLRLGETPVEDPDWDVGIENALGMPYYPSYDPFSPAAGAEVALDAAVTYDRIPKGSVEIRRASDVVSSDGHRLGEVDGLVVGEDGAITHLVLERGHLWGRREVSIPIGSVERVESDVVRLGITKDAVEDLPAVRVHRWGR